MKWIDAHFHLDGEDEARAEAVIARAKAGGLVHAILVGQFQGPGNFGNAIPLAAKFPGFLTPTMGIHPHEASRALPEDLLAMEELVSRPDVRGVGEAGLDYYYDRSPRDVQRQRFSWQCGLATQVNKPLVVHVRDAHDECHDILSTEKQQHGMIHCFTGDTDAARKYLSLGFFLSISGVLTYKKTEALQDAVKFAPLDRLMVETDSPYLAPVPYRGKKNEPAWVVETARKVAELKGVTLEQVSEATVKNVSALFGLKL